MRPFNRLLGFALATSLSLSGGLAQADTVTAATTAQQVRAIAQQGLQPLLQTNLMLIEAFAVSDYVSGCHPAKGNAVSFKVQSSTGSLSGGRRQSITVYRDASCGSKQMDVKVTVKETASGRTTTDKIAMTGTTFGSTGVANGNISYNGTFTANQALRKFSQTGSGSFSSGATLEALALSCDWSAYLTSSGGKPIKCMTGAAQKLNSIGKQQATLGSISVFSSALSNVDAGSFQTSQSGGALGVSVGSPAPKVVVTGSSVPVSHSALTFPGNGWKFTDSANGMAFKSSVSSSGSFTAAITKTSSGAKLATRTVDKFGNGTITYLPNGPSSKIVFWTLAN